jgi:UDP-N-acetyl-D-mannosaminuronate dehydrogenase
MSKTFLEQVTRVNTDLDAIAARLEDIRNAVATGDMVIEECKSDVGTHRTVLRVSVRPAGPSDRMDKQVAAVGKVVQGEALITAKYNTGNTWSKAPRRFYSTM